MGADLLLYFFCVFCAQIFEGLRMGVVAWIESVLLCFGMLSFTFLGAYCLVVPQPLLGVRWFCGVFAMKPNVLYLLVLYVKVIKTQSKDSIVLAFSENLF